jgi:hypothetical protein
MFLVLMKEWGNKFIWSSTHAYKSKMFQVLSVPREQLLSLPFYLRYAIWKKHGETNGRIDTQAEISQILDGIKQRFLL